MMKSIECCSHWFNVTQTDSDTIMHVISNTCEFLPVSRQNDFLQKDILHKKNFI